MSTRRPNRAKAHVPTKLSRRQVVALAVIPTSQDVIALVMRCSPKTLRRHYGRELAVGRCAIAARARHNETRRKYYALETARKPK